MFFYLTNNYKIIIITKISLKNYQNGVDIGERDDEKKIKCLQHIHDGNDSHNRWTTTCNGYYCGTKGNEYESWGKYNPIA